MKIRRILSIMLILTLSALLLTACQSEKTAWTLNEALQMIGTEQAAALNGRIPLSDDFSAYDCYSDGEYIPGSGKILILQREGPEKEYSRSSFDYPDGYHGEDKGAAKVWLRADLMDRIPESRRAATAEEAETIIMAESYYEKTGTMISEAESISGMNYDEYRPLFCAFNEVRLYSCENKGGQSIIWEEYCAPDLRDFPEADDLWNAIASLRETAEAAQLKERNERLQALMNCLDTLYAYEALPVSVLGRLYDLCVDDDMEKVVSLCSDTLWRNAEELSRVDSEYEKEFLAIIEQKDYEGLEALVISRNYTYADLTDTEILIRKAYMGTPDPERMPVLLDEAFSFLDDVEWNMTDARRILMYGY